MKNFVKWMAGGIAALLLCAVLSGPALSKSKSRSSGRTASTTLDEHPWDVLKRAVKIQVLAVTDEEVILLVWFNLEDPPVIIKLNLNDYFGGGDTARKKATQKFLSFSTE